MRSSVKTLRSGIGFSLGATLWFCCTFVIACGGNDKPLVTNLPPGDARRGENVFAIHCARCHSITTQVKAGPGLAHIGSRITAEKFQAIITLGPGDMPPRLVQGQEEADVTAYLLTLK